MKTTTPPRPFEVELSFEVKSYDIDFAGIVSNIVYIRWLEDLRLKILADYYPLERLLEERRIPVLVRTEIDYNKPVKMFDRVTGRMWGSELGEKRVLMSAEFFVEGELVAAAKQTGVFISLDDWRPVPVPEELAGSFQAYSES